MISVLLVDDDPAVRAGLRTIIDSSGDLRVVAEAWDGREAITQSRRLLPDVVVMDIRMPGMNGIAATRALLQSPSPPAVLILTTFGHDTYVEQALQAGAMGFVLKDTPPQELLTALRTVHAGNATFDPAVTRQVIDTATQGSASTTHDDDRALVEGLTDRQLEVLRLLAAGLSNTAIAEALHMTEGTVKGHVSQILTKLEADNRVQAARIAYRAGLDDLEP